MNFPRLAVVVLLTCVVASSFAQSPAKSVQERLGYPPTSRLLILHADDFGMNHSVNRAISEALEKKWITSASILVPCPWFLEAANFAKAHPDADLGIHQALNSEWTPFRWGPVSSKDKVPSPCSTDRLLAARHPDVVKNAKPAEVETELRAADRSRAEIRRPRHASRYAHGSAVSSRRPSSLSRSWATSTDVPILDEWDGHAGAGR